MSLLLALASATVTATCAPAAAPAETREEVVDSFFAAINRHDAPAIGKYIKPGAKLVTGGDAYDLAETMSAIRPGAAVTVLEKRFDPDKTIAVRYRTDGDSEETTVRFAQEGGCITGMTQI